MIWCEHIGMWLAAWLLASCSFLVPLFSFRYQSLNLTHVREHSMPIYQFRWYPPAGRGDFDWHCPRDSLMEGEMNWPIMPRMYLPVFSAVRERTMLGGRDTQRTRPTTDSFSQPAFLDFASAGINSTFSLVVFSSPLFLHSASCFWSYFSFSFHHVENAFHFWVGNPPSTSENGWGVQQSKI